MKAENVLPWAMAIAASLPIIAVGVVLAGLILRGGASLVGVGW
jgi:hypothetical protein